MHLVYHPRYLDHLQGGAGHPERPERLAAIEARLRAAGFWRDLLEPGPVDDADVLRVHRPAYLRRLAAFGEGDWDADTYVRPETPAIARLAAGGALLAVDTAWRDAVPALALLRPPGHHATPDTAMGFCYLNNAAIAAACLFARERRPLAIVDLDVHHGNGTQDIFITSRDILFISTHQYPHYPGTGPATETGAGDGAGHTVNLALPAGSGDGTFHLAFDRVIEPILRQFRPAMLLVSLGTDAHARDPLGDLTLSSAGYLHLGRRLNALAAELCGGRIAYLLEGGYDLEALADVITGLVALARGEPFQPDFSIPTDPHCVGRRAIEATVQYQAPFWQLDPVPQPPE